MKTKETKHTPGPWFVASRDGYNVCQIYARTGIDAHKDDSICQVYGLPSNTMLDDVKDVPRWENGLANARLIASAPELLEALKRSAKVAQAHIEEMQEEGDYGGNYDAEVDNLACYRVAIAKAEGRAL